MTAKKRTEAKRKVCSENGNVYELGKKLGRGGAGTVYRARRISDGKLFACKIFPLQNTMSEQQYAICQNVRSLIRKPILDRDGMPLRTMIQPLEFLEKPENGSFGYIMALLPDGYLPIRKLFQETTRPDAEALCKAGENIAHAFYCVHRMAGLCYKDVNDDNILIEPKTGDIRIIDTENLGLANVETVVGTLGYTAPEIYAGARPDNRSDQFGLASYLFRLFTGAFPMDGKATREYLIRHDTTVTEAAPEIYGTMALFAFDPIHTGNEVRSLAMPKSQGYEYCYEMETGLWDDCAEEIRECFMKTFSKGLHNRELRTPDETWEKTFRTVAQTGLVRCRCGKSCFGSRSRKSCVYCGAELPLLSDASIREPQGVVFKVKRNIGAGTVTVKAKRKSEINGYLLHPELPDQELMRIEYSPKRQMLSARNCSNLTWIVGAGPNASRCAPGERVLLTSDTVITVMVRKLQMKVERIEG